MPRPSFWENDTYYDKADFIIIGSGIVGLNTAINLKEKNPNSRVVILERGSLPTGASTRNGGFACFGSLSELIADMDTQSEDAVFSLVAKRWRGLQRLRERVGDSNLSYQQWGGYELFDEKEAAIYNSCRQRITYFNKKLASLTGHPEVYQLADDKLSNFKFNKVEHLIWNSAEGQLHAGRMMKALVDMARESGVVILNGVDVQSFESMESGVSVYAADGVELRAAKLGLCTNGFTKNLLSALKVEPARNQVLITKPIPYLKIKGTFHYDEGYVYFRNVGNRILLGGCRNRDKEVETTAAFGLTDNIKSALQNFLETVILPNQKIGIEQWWSGIMGLGNSKDPIVKEIEPNVYAGVRLGGMGVAIGSLVGEELAGLMSGEGLS